MNILFITNSIGYGGAEKMMNFVTDSLCSAGYKVVVLNLNTVSADINTNTQNLNPSIKILLAKNICKNKNLSAIKNILKIIKDYKIDMMITFTMFPNFYGSIASLLTKVPSIMSERGDPGRTFTNSFKDRILKLFINKAKGAVFQTKEASYFYSEKLQKRGVVIPNPIFIADDDIEFVSAKDRNKTVVSVGRFQNIQKRMDIMLKAFQIFSKSHPEYILKMYGSGEIDYVKSLCHELNITDKVQLMGVVNKPMTKIYNDGMFIITSDYEGIPNALLEAMAVGLPVISTDCTPGGARLLINNGENGILVPIRDYNAVATAMCRFAEDDALSDYCGKNAQKVIDNYAPEKISQLWIDYINKIVSH